MLNTADILLLDESPANEDSVVHGSKVRLGSSYENAVNYVALYAKLSAVHFFRIDHPTLYT